MGKELLQRVFYALPELETLWGVSEYEIREWIVHDQLPARVWLPLVVFHEVREQSEQRCLLLTSDLVVHREGYRRLSAHQCRRLFARGRLCLREFPNEGGNGGNVLPETADCIEVRLSDLVILHEDRLKFEAKWGLNPNQWDSGGPSTEIASEEEHDPSFKIVRHQGQLYSFGDMQAGILRHLYESAECGEPWQRGKQVLAKVGSSSYTLSNVFRHHPAWDKGFIQSDRLGSYRLSTALLRSIRQSKGS